jgi:hypothetical protein
VIKRSGLGKSFGKASLANTFLVLGRFIPMRDRSSWTGEGWDCNPSKAWPDEALEQGFAQPLDEEEKKLKVTSEIELISTLC